MPPPLAARGRACGDVSERPDPPRCGVTDGYPAPGGEVGGAVDRAEGVQRSALRTGHSLDLAACGPPPTTPAAGACMWPAGTRAGAMPGQGVNPGTSRARERARDLRGVHEGALDARNPWSRDNVRRRAVARAKVADAYQRAADTLAALAGWDDRDLAELLATPLVTRPKGFGRAPVGRRVRADTTPSELALVAGITRDEAAAILRPKVGERAAGVAPEHFPERPTCEGLRGADRRWRIWQRRVHAMKACETQDSVWFTADGELVVDGDGQPTTRGTRCESRLCGRCAARVAAKVRAGLAPVLTAEGRPDRFVLATFTRKASEQETLHDAYARLNGALDKLRHSKTWKRLVESALVAVEVTWSDATTRRKRARKYRRDLEALDRDLDAVRREQAAARGIAVGDVAWSMFPPTWQRDARRADSLRAQVRRLRASTSSHWHVHAHAIVLPRKDVTVDPETLHAFKVELLAAWSRSLDVPDEDCTVDVQRPRKTIEEVCKYAVKPLDLAAVPSDRLLELVTWLEGRRLVRTWGNWYARPDMTVALLEQDEREPFVDDAPVRNETVLGFRWSTRSYVLVAEAVLRCDEEALDVARRARALAWEEERERRRKRREVDDDTDDTMSDPPAPPRNARVVSYDPRRGIEVPGVVHVRGKVAADELVTMAALLEEERIEDRLRRAGGLNGLDAARAAEEVVLEVVSPEGVRRLNVKRGHAERLGAVPLEDHTEETTALVDETWGSA